MPKGVHRYDRVEPLLFSDSIEAEHHDCIFSSHFCSGEWLAAEHHDRFRAFAEALSRWSFLRTHPEFLDLTLFPTAGGISLIFRHLESQPTISFFLSWKDDGSPVPGSNWISVNMISPKCFGSIDLKAYCAVNSIPWVVASEELPMESRLDNFLSHLASVFEGPLQRYLDPCGWDRNLWTDCRELSDDQIREFSRSPENQQSTNVYDESIVGLLAHEGRCELMKELILAGVSPGEGAIGNLIKCDSMDELSKLPFLELLITHVKDVDQECQRHHATPLALAADRYNNSILRLLLRSGARVVSPDQDFGNATECILQQALGPLSVRRRTQSAHMI